MKTIILILKLLFVGALFIISNGNLHLGVPEERQAFFQSYFLWVDELFYQGADITSYVVKFEWLPHEENIKEVPPGMVSKFFSPKS